MAAITGPNDGEVIAIVGGGFSGSMVAYHLARQAGERRFRVLLFEKSGQFARGLAYGTTCDRHLLNVPAGLMSARPEEGSHFLDWLRVRDHLAHAGTFAPRRLYGDYLHELLSSVSRPGMCVETVSDEVVDARFSGNGEARFLLSKASGGSLECDRMVLAMGNQPPSDPEGVEGRSIMRRYASNPWGSNPLDGLRAEAPLALIGSGLTAVDIVVEAEARGHRGVIYAISRHGLLPCCHGEQSAGPHFDLRSEPRTARTLLRSVRAATAKCQTEGGDWRSVIDGIRPVAQSLWRSLDSRERQRFIRHLAPRWDVHRHRLAPEIDDLVQSRIRSQRLVVVAGRVLRVEEHGDGCALTVQRRGCTDVLTLNVARVINCTGPSRDIRRSDSSLLRSLLARGIVRAGPLALGLDVAESGSLIGHDGRPHERLFAVGPMLKEHLWETTAVRELRVQAVELARHLLANFEL